MGQRKGGQRSRASAEAATAASRLRELRLAAQATGEELARSVGASQSLISKFECGSQALSNKWAERLAHHFGVTPEYILWGRKNDAQGEAGFQASGLREEGAAFVADGGGTSSEPAAAGKPRKLSTFTLDSDDLAALGYLRGTILVVHAEPSRVAQLDNGSAVIVEVTVRGKVRRLAKQFVAPDLLCCNSGRSTGPVLRTCDPGVTIVGIIEGALDESPSRKPSVKRQRKPG